MSIFSVRVGGGTTFGCYEGNLRCTHQLRLFDVIPARHDLHAIVMQSLPEGLEKLSLAIGGQPVLMWHRDIDLEPGRDLLKPMLPSSLLLPISKCSYMQIDLMLWYDEQYVRKQEVWESEDEYEDDVCDECCRFLDDETGEIRWGRRVQYEKVRTGRRVNVLRCGAQLPVPEFALDVAPHVGVDGCGMDEVPIWQKLRLNKSDTEYIDKLRNKHGLRDVVVRGDTDASPAADADTTTFEVSNVIQFCNGMAGLRFAF